MSVGTMLVGGLGVQTPEIPVSLKKIHLDKKTGEQISLLNTKSGAGLQFLLLDRKAKASTKGMFCRHRDEEFTRLAETRLAQNNEHYLKIVQATFE